MLSDVCLSVAYIGPKSRTKRHRETKIGIEVDPIRLDRHHFQNQKVKGQGHQAALVGCTDRPTWTYSNGDLSICVHDVYRVTTSGLGGAYRGGRPPTACLVCSWSRSQMSTSGCLTSANMGSTFTQTGKGLVVRETTYKCDKYITYSMVLEASMWRPRIPQKCHVILRYYWWTLQMADSEVMNIHKRQNFKKVYNAWS